MPDPSYPVLVGRSWVFPDGTVLPLVAGGSDDGDPPAGDPPPPRSFTQEEVDRIVADRLRRVKVEPPADYDELKAKAAKLAEIEAASQSELERAQAAAAAAEAKAAEAQQRARSALLRASVTATAVQAGAVDADAVLALIDQSQLTVEDDGTVSGVSDAVKALLDAKPYLVGKPATLPPGSGDGGPRGKPAVGTPDFDSMTAAQINDWWAQNARAAS